MISLFWEGGHIGEAGGFVSGWNDIADDIKIDSESKKLTVTRGWTNKSYTFDLDGWTGRYGKPLEFLLSVHLATQMPDLAMEIADADEFDTMIYLVLHKVDNANIEAGYKTNSGAYILKSDIDKIDGWINFNRDYGYYMLFENGLEHAEDCECCSHINPNTNRKKEDEDCDEHPGNLTTDKDDFDLGWHDICDSCKKHADKVKDAVKEIQVDKLTTYTPYISKVENHWFRDVAFYIGDVSNTDVVINDENYYYETGERWSVYETYQEGESIPEGFSVGDYKLYEYENGKYTLSTKTRKEVDEINQKIQDGDTSVSKLVKKPVTKILSEIEDAEGNALISGIDGNVWSAYEMTSTSSDSWVSMTVDENSPNALQEFFKDEEGNFDAEKASGQDILVYKEAMQDTVKQIEDGQRFATNPKIKDMFINNKYYKYDGTVEKANKIMEDREKNNASVEDMEKNNTSSDKRDPKLLSKVSITKDSLAAFSILENMHTLDADYIYRDFKELIVELDYFNKEDLSDKIDTIMTWPLPDTGSSGWPVRKYEKGETYYGTLINSKADLEILREADIAKAEEEIHQLTGEGDVNKKNGNNTQAVVNSKINDNNTHALVSDKKTISGLTSAVSGASSSQPNMSMDEFVKTGYDVHAVMENSNNSGGNYWTYSLNVGSELKETVDEAISSNAHYCCCATFTSWVLKKAGYDLSNHPGIHCAPYSYDWMEEEGFTKITDYNELQPGDFLFNRFDYEGTDVNMIGHIQMLGNDGEWLNAGSTDAIQKAPYAYDAKFIIGMRPGLKGGSKQFEGYEPETAVVSPITGKILEYGTVNRTNEETGEEEEVGFIKIEAMDKYIYDIGSSVRDSGKGYESCKDPSDEFVETRENQNNQDALEREGYDYFYDEYKGVIDGFVLYMEGFDLTIDDDSELKKTPKYAPSMAGENQVKKKEPVEIKDEENVMSLYEKGDKDSLSGLSQYQANEVPNMVDDLEEARSIWKEDAKASAIPILKVGDDWYIKEGTVIGKTCKDPEEDETNTTSKPKTTTATGQGEEESADEEKGNGNYMRLILRNLDDSIVEDIENYFPLDGASTSLGDQEYQAQPGDLELLAKIINAEFCGAYAESLIGEEHGKDAAKTVGYVIINRALSNYGGYGTTIKEQYLAPGQYEGAAEVIAGPECTCDVCIECAEWCLKYDCSCIVSPTSNKPMPRNIFGQSGWCFCKGSVGNNCPGSNLNHCWWCVDVTKDGRSTTYDESPNFYDVFFCEL